MKLYNTLTRQKEEFVPLEGNETRIYSCGPTVYQYAHIGNLRTYIFMDILRRVLKYNGYSLKHVMNITDVGHLVSDSDEGEDKMMKTAKAQQKSPWEIAEYYTGIFMKDIEALNIDKPEIIPKATEHINEMLDFVVGLVEKGYGYETSDGIYFDVMKFEGYGKLSGLDLEGQIAGARVDVNEEKHHPADFALWKRLRRSISCSGRVHGAWATRAGT
jgi:cysteinyl-tRNA synthetase